MKQKRNKWFCLSAILKINCLRSTGVNYRWGFSVPLSVFYQGISEHMMQCLKDCWWFSHISTTSARCVSQGWCQRCIWAGTRWHGWQLRWCSLGPEAPTGRSPRNQTGPAQAESTQYRQRNIWRVTAAGKLRKLVDIWLQTFWCFMDIFEVIRTHYEMNIHLSSSVASYLHEERLLNPNIWLDPEHSF